MSAAPRCSPEWRASVSRGVRLGLARRRHRLAAEARIGGADLRAFADAGVIAPALRPLVEAELQAGVEVLEALAPDPSPQQRTLVADCTRLGVVMRGELAKYLERQDADAATRITAVANARRSILTTLGLERYARDATPDLRRYLEQRAGNGSGANGAGDGPVLDLADDRHAEANLAHEAPLEERTEAELEPEGA